MTFFILLMVLPALAAVLLLDKRLSDEPFLLRLSLGWFAGQALTIPLVYLLSCALSAFTEKLLFKAAVIEVIILSAFIVFASKRLLHLPRKSSCRGPEQDQTNDNAIPWMRKLAPPLFIVVVSFVLSVIIYQPHLSYRGGDIFRSPVYWDFGIHYPIIQTMVHADNFPTENEMLAGIPATYHFFFDLLTASIHASGLDLATSIDTVSALSLFFLILLAGALAQRWFRAPAAPFFLPLLIVGSSHLRLFYELPRYFSMGLRAVLAEMLYSHPYFHSFLHNAACENKYPCQNGNMLNIFYFIAERQLVFACGLFLCALFLLSVRLRFHPIEAFFLGAALGLFYQWHLFVALLIGATLFSCLLTRRGRVATSLICLGFLASSTPQFWLIRQAMANSDWFLPSIFDFPRFNTGFSGNSQFTTIPYFVSYYTYSLGILPLVLVGAVLVLLKRSRDTALLLCCAIVIAFVLLNSVQLSPVSVWDNHKWLKPLLVVTHVLAGGYLGHLLKRLTLLRLLGVLLLFLTLSSGGLIEIIPFILSKPEVAIPVDQRAVSALRTQLPRRSVVVSDDPVLVLYAGRKMYCGDTGPLQRPFDHLFFVANIGGRKKSIERIYGAKSVSDFCRELEQQNIDIVSFNQLQRSLPIFSALGSFPQFDVQSGLPRQSLTFVNASSCQSPTLSAQAHLQRGACQKERSPQTRRSGQEEPCHQQLH